MDLGNLILDGSPKEVTGSYQKLAFASPEDATLIRHTIMTGESNAMREADEVNSTPTVNKPALRGFFDSALLCFDSSEWPRKGAYIEAPSLMDEHENIVNVIYRDAVYTIVYFVDFDTNAYSVAFGMLVKTLHGA